MDGCPPLGPVTAAQNAIMPTASWRDALAHQLQDIARSQRRHALHLPHLKTFNSRPPQNQPRTPRGREGLWYRPSRRGLQGNSHGTQGAGYYSLRIPESLERNYGQRPIIHRLHRCQGASLLTPQGLTATNVDLGRNRAQDISRWVQPPQGGQKQDALHTSLSSPRDKSQSRHGITMSGSGRAHGSTKNEGISFPARLLRPKVATHCSNAIAAGQDHDQSHVPYHSAPAIPSEL
jgi:hypothetical protein